MGIISLMRGEDGAMAMDAMVSVIISSLIVGSSLALMGYAHKSFKRVEARHKGVIFAKQFLSQSQFKVGENVGVYTDGVYSLKINKDKFNNQICLIELNLISKSSKIKSNFIASRWCHEEN